MSVHGTKGKFIEYWGRGETGPIAFQKEFDTKIYWPRLKELTKKYNIEYAPGKVVPTDDDELDAIWQAGRELLLDVGILNVSTERRITFTEDELDEALENLPTEVTLGEGKDAITIPQFFSNRFGDKKKVLTLIAALVIIIFFIPYTASGFAAIGKLFSSLFEVDYHLAMIVGAIVIISYTMTGGFIAASFTDLVQSVIMSIALAVVLFFGINQAGGMGAVMDNAKSLTGQLSLTLSHVPDPNNMFAAGTSSPYGFLTIVSTMAWGLGYFGMPHILLRFMAIEDENKLKLSRRIASIWVVIAMGVAILIGLVGLGMTAAGVIPQLTTAGSAETIIVSIAHHLSTYGFFPALIAGLILSGIMASTMSTADSQLLAASSSVSQDILTGFFGVKLDDKKLLKVARASLLVIAVIGVFLAWNPESSVFRIVSFAWAGFGASFGPLVLFSLFWRRTNRQGALAGMIVGGSMIFIWKFLVRPLGGILDIYELLPAFILSSLAIVIVSLLTKAPDKEVTDVFDQVKAMK